MHYYKIPMGRVTNLVNQAGWFAKSLHNAGVSKEDAVELLNEEIDEGLSDRKTLSRVLVDVFNRTWNECENPSTTTTTEEEETCTTASSPQQ